MARAKKEAALMPEERLQAALVPDWEWPYKLPENWCWTKLGEISEIIMGQSPSGAETTDDSSYMPLIGGAADMGDMYPQATRFTKVPTKVSKKDDLILCIRATLGRPVFSDGEYCLGRGVAGIRPWYGCKEFYKYFFLNFEQYLYDNATGSTFAQVTGAILQNMPTPLPPLAEQQRIVDRIESLFAKLDEAKEKAQTVVDSFETRKAAILHKAFTGELTAKWRKEHGVGMEKWAEKRFKEILDVRDGTHDSPQYYEQGYPLVTSKNLKDGMITDKDIKFISKEDYEQINQRSKVDIGDILFAMIGTIGNPVVVTEEPKYAIKNVALMKNIGKADPFFVRYYLETKYVKDKMQTDAKGSTQKFVPLGYLRDFRIKLPNTDEQAEIVRILDDLFAKELQAKEAAEAMLKKIDLMKKAILARAFRGDLGTNDPADEPAVELIKSILQQKIEQGNKPKKQEKKGNHKEENIVAKTILEVLTVQKRATPESLKKGTELDIDDFYDQVKALIASKAITETREGNEVFLEVTHEDRQVNN